MNVRTSVLVVVAVSILVACSRDDRRHAPAAREVAAKVPLAASSQTDLAREVDEAERRGTWREVRTRWQGQRLRWKVTRHRALCESSSACHVAAFPIQRPAQHGWLPALEFAPGERARLEASCGNAEACEIEIEGTLSELVLSAELPTSLRLTNVRIVRS